MMLDFSCVKDILIEVEDKSTFSKVLTFTIDENNLDFPELYSRYSTETIMYHVRYCIDAGLLKYVNQYKYHNWLSSANPVMISIDINPDTTYIDVYDLTPLGHDMATTLRKKNYFDTALSLINQLGLNSLPVWLDILRQVRTIPS